MTTMKSLNILFGREMKQELIHEFHTHDSENTDRKQKSVKALGLQANGFVCAV